MTCFRHWTWQAPATALVAFLAAAPTWAEEDLAGLWGSTPTSASAYAGSGSPSAWNLLWSLLLVLGLLLLLAWGLRRLWRQAPARAEAPERVLFTGRFNPQQTLIVSAQGTTLRCLVARGKRIDCFLELPDTVKTSGSGSGGHGRPGGSPSFAETWQMLLRGVRK